MQYQESKVKAELRGTSHLKQLILTQVTRKAKIFTVADWFNCHHVTVLAVT
jgi:hypothetical protein